MYIRQRKIVFAEGLGEFVEYLNKDCPKAWIHSTKIEVLDIFGRKWAVGRDEGLDNIEVMAVVGRRVKDSLWAKSI